MEKILKNIGVQKQAPESKKRKVVNKFSRVVRMEMVLSTMILLQTKTVSRQDLTKIMVKTFGIKGDTSSYVSKLVEDAKELKERMDKANMVMVSKD